MEQWNNRHYIKKFVICSFFIHIKTILIVTIMHTIQRNLTLPLPPPNACLNFFRKNQKYHHRLNEECCAMKNKIAQLKKDIKEAKIKKFGQVLDVEILEETVLKKMIQDVQDNISEEEMKKYYDMKIVQLKVTTVYCSVK